jgi:Na+/melibiose symporter-like transporter
LEETVKEEHRSLPIRASLSALKGNWPWIIIFLSSLFFWIAFIARVCAAPYFFQYTLQRKDLISVANSLDFISLATVFCLPFFCRLTSKRNVWAFGLLGMALGQLIVYFGMRDGNSIPWIMTGWILGFLASGVAMAMPFSVLSDSVDYGEWRSGVRAAGFLTAIGAAFCLKAGSGLGGALPAWILSAHGYVANQTQTADSLKGIELGFIWLPVLGFILSIIPVLFYQKYELMEPLIHAELERRRAAAPGAI